MKEKLYYNFVNALSSIGILSVPVGLLIYILFDTKIIDSYINHFNILIYSVLICILSFILFFILKHTSNYRRIALKYKEVDETVYELKLTDDIDNSLAVTLKKIGYRENDLPKFKSVFIEEKLMPSGKVYAKVIKLVEDNKKPREYVKQLDNVLRKYYQDNKIDIEAIIGVVCFKSLGKKAQKFSNVRDYLNYSKKINSVSHFVLCSADAEKRVVYFNNDNIVGKRGIPLKMITDIFGRAKEN